MISLPLRPRSLSAHLLRHGPNCRQQARAAGWLAECGRFPGVGHSYDSRLRALDITPELTLPLEQTAPQFLSLARYPVAVLLTYATCSDLLIRRFKFVPTSNPWMGAADILWGLSAGPMGTSMSSTLFNRAATAKYVFEGNARNAPEGARGHNMRTDFDIPNSKRVDFGLYGLGHCIGRRDCLGRVLATLAGQ